MSRKRPQPPVKPFKKKPNPLKAAKVTEIDYKDVALLRKFISDRGKIRSVVSPVFPCRNSAKSQGYQERPRDGSAAVRHFRSLILERFEKWLKLRLFSPSPSITRSPGRRRVR